VILIKDNILSKEECIKLIYYHNTNKYLAKPHNTIFPIDLTNINDAFIDSIKSKILNEATKLKQVSIEWIEITKVPDKVGMDYHYDNQSDSTILTSVTYLNNNFRGGRTCFEDGTKISPVIGRTIFFDGQKYKHGIEPVLANNRYTIPCWYKNNV